MLINLYAFPKNKKLEFDLPSLFFKQDQEVCVTEICGILDPKRIDKDSSLFILSSTLVDKSPINLKQQLLFIKTNIKTIFKLRLRINNTIKYSVWTLNRHNLICLTLQRAKISKT